MAAPPERALALFEDVGAYPSWYGEVVREVTVLERDGAGAPRRARVTLHVALGPVNRDLALTMSVGRAGPGVTLARVANESSDRERFEVRWRATPAGTGTQIELDLEARLDVPRLVPVGAMADSLASGFAGAAARELDRRA